MLGFRRVCVAVLLLALCCDSSFVGVAQASTLGAVADQTTTTALQNKVENEPENTNTTLKYAPTGVSTTLVNKIVMVYDILTSFYLAMVTWRIVYAGRYKSPFGRTPATLGISLILVAMSVITSFGWIKSSTSSVPHDLIIHQIVNMVIYVVIIFLKPHLIGDGQLSWGNILRVVAVFALNFIALFAGRDESAGNFVIFLALMCNWINIISLVVQAFKHDPDRVSSDAQIITGGAVFGILLCMFPYFAMRELWSDHSSIIFMNGMLATTIFDFLAASLAIVVAVFSNFQEAAHTHASNRAACEMMKLQAHETKFAITSAMVARSQEVPGQVTGLSAEKTLQHAYLQLEQLYQTVLTGVEMGGCGDGSTSRFIRDNYDSLSYPEKLNREEGFELLDGLIHAMDEDTPKHKKPDYGFFQKLEEQSGFTPASVTALFAAVVAVTALRDIYQTGRDLEDTIISEGMVMKREHYEHSYLIFVLCAFGFIVLWSVATAKGKRNPLGIDPEERARRKWGSRAVKSQSNADGTKIIDRYRTFYRQISADQNNDEPKPLQRSRTMSALFDDGPETRVMHRYNTAPAGKWEGESEAEAKRHSLEEEGASYEDES